MDEHPVGALPGPVHRLALAEHAGRRAAIGGHGLEREIRAVRGEEGDGAAVRGPVQVERGVGRALVDDGGVGRRRPVRAHREHVDRHGVRRGGDDRDSGTVGRPGREPERRVGRGVVDAVAALAVDDREAAVRTDERHARQRLGGRADAPGRDEDGGDPGDGKERDHEAREDAPPSPASTGDGRAADRLGVHRVGGLRFECHVADDTARGPDRITSGADAVLERRHREVDRLGEPVRDPGQLVVGDHERRTQQDRVAIGAVGVARAGVQQQAAVAGRGDDRLDELRRARPGLARLAVPHELDADHQSPPPDVADDRVRVQPLVEQGREPFALRGRCADQRLGLEDPQHLPRDRRGRRLVRVGEPVDERPGARDRVVHLARGRHEPERPVARRGALGGHEEVGLDAEVGHAEPLAGPPEPGHHLVRDEQRAVPPADVGDRGPVAARRLDGGERGPDDRLGDERGDGPGPGHREGLVQLVDERLRRAQRLRPGVVAAVRVRGADVAEAPEPRLVRAAQRPPAREVEGAQRVAVVAAPAREHHQAVRLAARELRRPGELEGRLDRLRPARDRVDRRVGHRQVRRDVRGVALQRLGREGAAVGVGEARGLLGDDVRDLAPAVAHVDDDRAARGVEVLAAVGVDDRRPVGLDGDRRVGRRGAAEDAAAHGRRRAGVAHRWITPRVTPRL